MRWYKCLATILMYWMFFVQSAYATGGGKKDVTIYLIHGIFNTGMWQAKYEDALKNLFKTQSRYNVNIHIEYLGFDPLLPASYNKSIASYINNKLEYYPADIVVGALVTANDFIYANSTVFQRSPKIFVIPSNNLAAKISPNDNTYLIKSASLAAIEKTLKLIPIVLPDIKRLIVVSGMSPNDQFARNSTKSFIDKGGYHFRTEFWDGKPPEEIIEQLKNNQKDTAIFMMSYEIDKNKKFIVTTDVTAQLSKNLDIPIFCYHDSSMNNGVLGGNMTSYANYANQTYNAVMQLLDGTTTNNIRIDASNVTSNQFDWQLLKRYGLNARRLPKDTIFINRPPSLWEQHRTSVIAAVLVFLTLTALLLISLHQNIRRKRAEASLRESEAFRKRLFDTSRIPIVVMDAASFLFVDCNPAAVKLYRFPSRDDVLGKTPLDVSAPEQYDGTPSPEKAGYFIEQAKQKGAVVFEWRHQRPDGDVWDAEVHLASFHSGQRQFMQFTLQDITERKRVETLLLESEKKYHDILEISPIAIFQRRLNGEYTYFNNVLIDMFECGSKDEFIANYSAAEKRWVELDKLEEFNNLLMCNKTVRDFHVKTQLLNGNTKWFSLYVELDEPNSLINGFTLDITDHMRAKEELKQYHDNLETLVEERTAQLQAARDAADAANLAKSMFLANMSHEIRTPMNAVLGFAQLLQHDSSLSPAALNKVSTIIKSGDHLLAIINDILEMSRIEAGRIELHTESVDLHSLLDDLGVMFRMRCEGKGLSFTLQSAGDLPRYIVIDLGKLRQILINLLGNAVKYTKVGSITLRAAFVDSTRLAIEVQDSGIGISPEEQAKLFQPFERTKSGEQAAGGTGLGLSISREYAQLMGGNITVTSKPGEGSCFCFEFPVQLTSDVPAASDRPRRITGLIPGQGEIRVLVVDDLKENRELLRGMLEPLGFIIDEASDGQEAIDKVNTRKPQMILMDQVMPGMNGSEATSILRVTNSKESLPIIGITASTFEDEKQQFRKAGLNAYIAKPFREQELYDVLSRYAGVLFETEEDTVSPDMQQEEELPTLEKMSSEWRAAFREALTRKNITRIRILSEEAKATDPVLSEWLLDRAGRYDLDGLKLLCQADKPA